MKTYFIEERFEGKTVIVATLEATSTTDAFAQWVATNPHNSFSIREK